MKIIISLSIFFTFSNLIYGQKTDEGEVVVNQFVNDMKSNKILIKHLSSTFLIDEGLDNNNCIVDFLTIKRFKIKSISAIEYLVSIDHGSGSYCTEFVLKLTRENGNLKLLPASVIYNSKIKKYIVTAWWGKVNKCK